jgi:probable phosphoglycerate mutase
MVYLVRHGETAWTVTAQHTGHTDLPLSEQGERQACELGTRLGGLRFERVLSSPLRRARQTAALALPGVAVEDDDDLSEWDYGDYEGRRTIDIELERPGWRLFRDGCPAGETLDAVCERADRVIGRIRAFGGNMVIVAHRDVLRILAVRWIGLAAIEGRRLLLATASLSGLGYDRNLTEPTIHFWNLHDFSASNAVIAFP